MSKNTNRKGNKKAVRGNSRNTVQPSLLGRDGLIQSLSNGRYLVIADYDTEWRSGFTGHTQFKWTNDYLVTDTARAIIKGFEFFAPVRTTITWSDPVVCLFGGTKEKRELIQLVNVDTLGVYTLVDVEGQLDRVPGNTITDNILRQVPGVRRLRTRLSTTIEYPPLFRQLGTIRENLPDGKTIKDVRSWVGDMMGTYEDRKIPLYIYLGFSDFLTKDSVTNVASVYCNLKFETVYEVWGRSVQTEKRVAVPGSHFSADDFVVLDKAEARPPTDGCFSGG